MNKLCTFSLLLIVLLLLTAIRPVGAAYRLQEGDQIQVIFPEGELREQYKIDIDGVLHLPDVDFPVPALGKTIDQVKETITLGLRRYFKDPTVTIQLITYQQWQVHFTGAVKNPGVRKISRGLRIMELLDVAAIDPEDVNRRNSNVDYAHIQIHHPSGKTDIVSYSDFVAGDTTQNIVLENGDIIHVPSNLLTVHFFGTVNSQGKMAFAKGTTLLEALSQQKGLPFTARNKISVIRPGESQTFIYRMSYKKLLKSGGLHNNLILADGDVIYATKRFWPRISTVNEILQSLGLITALRTNAVIFSLDQNEVKSRLPNF